MTSMSSSAEARPMKTITPLWERRGVHYFMEWNRTEQNRTNQDTISQNGTEQNDKNLARLLKFLILLCASRIY